MKTVVDLRCEYQVNPMGVETAAPRLSWGMEADERGARQSAYRIEVASAADRLAEGEADRWDSGRVESDSSVLVPYGGARLRSRHKCWWRLHVWGEDGAELVSEPAYWEMGLLHPSDWKAQWIAGGTPKIHHDVAAAPMFRKAFPLKKKVASARAYVCGLGYHEFYLNGRKVSDAVLHPAFTKYDARVLYTVLDVTDYLVNGDNVAGVIVGTGWYDHHLKGNCRFFAAPWRDECKAVVQIEVTFEDGSRRRVVSDASWFYSSGPIVFDGVHSGEIYDAREEKAGWNAAGYDGQDWRGVRITRPPGGIMRGQIMPPCRVFESIRPVSVKEVKPGVWVYDMGRNMVGWAQLTVSGPAGTTVVMCHSEKLGDDGDIDQSNIDWLFETDVFQTNSYTLRGDGVETYEPRFAYHGFQYVQVTGLPGPATVDMLEGRVVHADLERIGTFECSNDLLNRIQAASIASTVGNYHATPTDCPHREKNGWTGDAHLSTEQVLYNLEPSAAYTKWLDDFTDCQRPSGAFPGIIPTGGWGYNWGAGPAWDSAFILIPWYLYVYRGDVEILRRHYDRMKKYLGFLDSMATDYIVHFGLGDWCPPVGELNDYRAPAELTNTAYYYADACIVAKIAGLLGKKSDVRRYESLAENIKAAARKTFYDKKDRRLVVQSQTSIACFLYQGLVEDDEIEVFTAMLLEEVRACNDHLDCGILGTKYLLNVLTMQGEADAAYRIATQRDFPSWGHWMEQGATTLWERWDGSFSHNHHAFCYISEWFYKTLAGIVPDPSQPGFKHVIIAPWPVGDLTWAKGETRTPYGRLRSAWRKEDGRFRLDISIPPNSSASVHLPTAEPAAVLDSGREVGESEYVSLQGVDRGRVVYAVGAGDYGFELEL